jgi:Fe-S-cluster containining protein
MCGQCCKNHSLPLTLTEAIRWLEDGGDLALFCEAVPWDSEPPPENLRAAHQKKRSFPVACGSSSVRVTVIFVGVISGSCMHLGEDLKCGIYERRPLVCRIYPAEISPFIQLNIAAKSCPPECWSDQQPLLVVDGIAVDPHLRDLIERSRQTDRDEAARKGILCSDLGISTAAVSDEGFVGHEPERELLLKALRKVRDTEPHVQLTQTWRLYSREPATLERLAAQGMELASEKRADDRFVWIHAPRPVA